MGVRLGMTAMAARARSPELHIVTADAKLERETVRAIADALLGVSATVDVGGRVGAGGAHLALYCEVPVKTRGAAYGDRLLDLLDVLGVTGRIGIADDRFTAWVAAAHGGDGGASRIMDRDRERGLFTGVAAAQLDATNDHDRGVVSVPRGGSAAFLAPRPLSLLAIPAEVQHMLEVLGVGTLGEFAALPAPSVTRRPGVRDELAESDYQALARGESGHDLRPYTPEASIREDVAISTVVSGPAAIEMLARRLALRLAGRARGAARLELTIGKEGQADRVSQLTLDGVATDAEELAEAIGEPVMSSTAATSSWRLRVVVTGEAIVGADVAAVAAAPLATDVERIDALSLVLSTTGSSSDLAAWHLDAPTSTSARDHGATLRGERRDSHRRTRRGKQQRRRVAPLAQSRLFKNLEG
jgi:hypothetical protein